MSYVDVTLDLPMDVRVWRELRFARAPMTLFELWRSVRPDFNHLVAWLDGWSAAGMIALGKRSQTITMNKQVKARCANPPRQKATPRNFHPSCAYQRIWTAIRVMRTFDVPALLMAAETGKRHATNYFNQLERAGYLKRIDTPDEFHRRYRLLRDTGPRHPVMTRTKQDGFPAMRITDANTGEQTSFELTPKSLRNRDAYSFALEN